MCGEPAASMAFPSRRPQVLLTALIHLDCGTDAFTNTDGCYAFYLFERSCRTDKAFAAKGLLSSRRLCRCSVLSCGQWKVSEEQEFKISTKLIDICTVVLPKLLYSKNIKNTTIKKSSTIAYRFKSRYRSDGILRGWRMDIELRRNMHTLYNTRQQRLCL